MVGIIIESLFGIALSYVAFKRLPVVFNFLQETTFKRYCKIKDAKKRKDTPFPNEKVSSFSDKELREIICKIEKSFNQKDLNNFHYNIKNLKVRLSNNLNDEVSIPVVGVVEGCYDVKRNQINLLKDRKMDNVLLHEMLHLASSKNIGLIRNPHMGFQRRNILSSSIGIGLDEGYTEYLTNYLAKSTNYKSYIFEMIVARSIEDIIGKEEMRSLYLNSDLKGLYDKLSKYYSKEEIDHLLISMDNICIFGDVNSSEESLRNLKYRSYEFIATLLHKGLLLKMNEERYSGNSIRRYFTDLNNVIEGIEYHQNPRYDKIVKTIRDKQLEVYTYLSQGDINVGFDDLSTHKEYSIKKKVRK